MTSHSVGQYQLRLCLALASIALLGACQSVVGPERLVQVLEIAPQKVPCTGVAPQECMLVRSSDNTEWQYFYDEIEGFEFDPGFSYMLRVERTAVKNPPADGSLFSYRLLALISKTPAVG